MKKIQIIILLLCTVLFAVGCSTSVKTTLTNNTLTALSADSKVVVISPDEAAPGNAKVVGKVKIGDSGFTTNCGYTTVVEQAKAEARKSGGNMLKLTKVKEPSALGSSCYRIEADILFVNDVAGYISRTTMIQDSITRTKFPENPDYALLYVYRRGAAAGALLNYTIHLDGKPLFKIYNDSKEVVKVYTEGKHLIRASLETEAVKEVDIKFGEEYFLECSITTGTFIGRPELNFVDKKMGREAYERVGN